MNINFTIHWWYVPIILFFVPFVYAGFRKSGGDWDFQIDMMIVTAAAWCSAIAIVIGHFLK